MPARRREGDQGERATVTDTLLKGVCTNDECESRGQDWDIWANERDHGLVTYDDDDEFCPDCGERGAVSKVADLAS